MFKNEVSYKDGDQNCISFVATKDEKEKRPAVLICHAWAGRDEFACDMAIKIAEMGYVGVALDNYGDKKIGTNTDENSALMTPFVEDRKMLAQRLEAGLKNVASLSYVDENNIVAIGFCFGGLCVLDMARSNFNLKGVVSFHGLLMEPDYEVKSIKPKVLVLHGQEDPMVDMEKLNEFIAEMREKAEDWQLHCFGKTVHAFTNPQANDPSFGTVYNVTAADRSYKMLEDFLEESFS